MGITTCMRIIWSKMDTWKRKRVRGSQRKIYKYIYTKREREEREKIEREGVKLETPILEFIETIRAITIAESLCGLEWEKIKENEYSQNTDGTWRYKSMVSPGFIRQKRMFLVRPLLHQHLPSVFLDPCPEYRRYCLYENDCLLRKNYQNLIWFQIFFVWGPHVDSDHLLVVLCTLENTWYL